MNKETEPKQPSNEEKAQMQYMIQENQRYINIAVNKIKELEIEQFKTYIQEYEDQGKVDQLINKYKPFLALAPSSVIHMIKASTPQAWLDLLKEQTPDKYEYLVKEKKIEHITNIIQKIIDLIKLE